MRPPEVVALVLMDVAGALLCLAGVVHPPAPGSPVLIDAVALVLATAFAVALWVLGPRTPRGLLHANVLAYLVFTTAVVVEAATGEGAVSGAVSYVIIALYVAAFLPRRLVRPQLAGIVAVSAVALHLSEPVGNPLPTWLPLGLATAVAGEFLSSLVERLRVLTVTDPLTGCLNRAGLDVEARREQAVSARSGAPLTIVAVDVDGFKVINDVYGHAAGDELLQRLTAGWRVGLRPRDVVCRRGGDEFALLLPDTDEQGAAAVVRRLRADAPIEWSHGIAPLGPDDDIEASLALADARMYRQKRSPAGPDPSDHGLVGSPVTGAPHR